MMRTKEVNIHQSTTATTVALLDMWKWLVLIKAEPFLEPSIMTGSGEKTATFLKPLSTSPAHDHARGFFVPEVRGPLAALA